MQWVYILIDSIVDVIFVSIPVVISDNVNYTIFSGESFLSLPAIPSSTCGNIVVANSEVILSTNASLTLQQNCSIMISEYTFDVAILSYSDSWDPFPIPSLDVQSVNVQVESEIAALVLMTPFQLVKSTDQVPRIKYRSDPALPNGLQFLQYTIAGSPLDIGSSLCNIYAYDTLTNASIHIATYKFTVLPVPKSYTAIAVGASLGFLALLSVIFLIIWLRNREDQKKLYHIFVSYRVATDAKLAEQVTFELQKRFLTSGHRVQ